MQYAIYRPVNGEDSFVAIRHHWGKEEKIYEQIGNAFVIQMLDHLFLFPLNAAKTFIPTHPNIVMDGVYRMFDESCDFCKHRLEKVTENCKICAFEALRENNTFQLEQLKAYLIETEAKQINILELMAKNDIYQIFYLYHFKNFYDQEMPLSKEAFLKFISQFDVEILHQNEKEIILKKEDFFYETIFQKNYTEEKMNKTDLEGLKKVYGTIKEKIESLKEREVLLKRIIGETK